MSVKYVLCKDQIINSNYNGAIRERKILGYPHEKTPIKSYSNIFYWTYLESDFGSIIPDHAHIGFEIVTFVIKGGYEITDKNNKCSIELKEGDISIVKSGKGILHGEKLLPRTELLQVWFDPNFDKQKQAVPGVVYFPFEQSHLIEEENKSTWKLFGHHTSSNLNSKNSSVEVTCLHAGFHTFICPEDSVMSFQVLEGFVEVDEVMLGKNDFFKVEDRKEFKIISLVNSKLFVTVTPYQPEFKYSSSLSSI